MPVLPLMVAFGAASDPGAEAIAVGRASGRSSTVQQHAERQVPPDTT